MEMGIQTWIDIVSALILVFTLFILWKQVSKSINAARSQAYAEITGQTLRLNMWEFEHGSQTLLEKDTVSEKEKDMQEKLVNLELNLYECIFLQREEGVISPETFDGWKNQMKDRFAKSPAFSSNWDTFKPFVNVKFAQFIEKEVIPPAAINQASK